MTVARGTLLGSGEQRLHDLQGLHGGVLVEVVGVTDSAGCRHEGHTVVLDQNRSPNHCTVQLEKPGRERRRNYSMK